MTQQVKGLLLNREVADTRQDLVIYHDYEAPCESLVKIEEMESDYHWLIAAISLKIAESWS